MVELMTSTDARDVEPAVLGRYLERHVSGFRGPLTMEKFGGGQSNPTFLVRAQSGDYVLRRQPAGELLKSAHAVDREFRVIAALAGTDVPVPRAYHLCADREVLGSMFYVMSFEQGRIFWDPALPDVSASQRAECYEAMLRTMAALHDVNVDAAGLSDYGRGGNYFERQIALWTRQYRASETERIPAMDRLIAWLPANCPASDAPPSVVHGDFRIDNVIFHPEQCNIMALLDWELSTLGDPLADLAYFCMCLRLPADGYITGLAGRSRRELAVPEEQAIVRRYCELRGIEPIADWHFYLAFSFFRLAAIVQGVKKRALNGNASSAKAQQVGDMAAPLAAMATALIDC